ncbi:hypothetical protein [Catellatospora paridis]|uniref:hypothetical protein n=1 Tax=Catellatospora paridis TaxID=1617086 RepID=UPI0012D44CD9|nr:hypothetical protein [Catellatospora paridis]
MDATRAGVGSDPLAHINVSRLRSDLRAVQALGTTSGALRACTVSADIRQAYGTALRARDEAAAYLHGNRDWTTEDLAEVICGHRADERRVRLIAEWSTAPQHAPQHLYDAGHELLHRQQLANELRDLLSEARATAVHHLREAELMLPPDPLTRVHKATDMVRFSSYHLDVVAANRNLYAANLVVHHEWDLDEIAELAEAEPDAIAGALDAARTNPPSDADSRSVRELAAIAAALAARRSHWESARQEAVAECLAAGVDPERVAAYSGG